MKEPEFLRLGAEIYFKTAVDLVYWMHKDNYFYSKNRLNDWRIAFVYEFEYNVSNNGKDVKFMNIINKN